MQVACLDLEGVLVPEVWINVAARTGIEALKVTTRDMPDYDALMRQRLRILDEHRLGITDIQATISEMGTLPGAREFLDWLREHFQVIILSDTFYEFAEPLIKQLGNPVLLCHRLSIDEAGKIVDYRLRMPDQKRAAVEAFRSLRFQVIAVGDSYNDTNMLRAADVGILFRPPDNVIAEFPEFPVTRTYDELRVAFEQASTELDEQMSWSPR